MTTVEAVPHVASPARRRTLQSRRQMWGLFFVLPSVIFFSIFMLIPMINGVYLSLTTFTLLQPPRFVGLQNYQDLLTDRQFIKAIDVTLKFVLGSTIPVWILSLALGVLFFQKFRGREIFKTLFFLPVLPSLTVISVIWIVLLNPTGLLTQLLYPITGQGQIKWLNDVNLTPFMMIVVNNWATIPFYMLIWLAGLNGIPPELRDAARVDGATRFKSFLRVEFPLLRPTAVLVAALSTINAFQAFNLQYVMTPNQGGPVDSTTTIGLLIWKYGFQYYRMGEAAAMSVILFVVIMIVTLIQLRLGRSEDYSVS
jgi:multiple sugar transport system permease protein